MRALLAVLPILVAGLGGAAAAACLPQQLQAARVAAVSDPRTIALEDGRLVRPAAIESFALIGADPAGAEQRLAEGLSTLLAGSRAWFHFLSDEPDRYGRIAALIAVGGRLLQAQLAGEGVAVAFPEEGGAPCTAEILAAEAAARDRQRGLWQGTAVLPGEPGALSPHLGSYVIFEGKVLSVGSRIRRTYLNFGRRWSEDVTVVVEARDRETFGGAEALEALAGRRVRVRGFLEERGGPLVIARWPGQIEVLGPQERRGNGS